MSDRFAVHQHLTVEAVVQRCASVRVEVSGVRGDRQWIDFRFADPAIAAEQAWTIAGWRDRRQPVTYVRGGVESALLDDEELFHRAFADDDLFRS